MKLIIIVLFMISGFLGLMTGKVYGQSAECIQTFDEFAYRGPYIRSEGISHPSQPWREISQVPDHPFDEFSKTIFQFQPLLSRHHRDETEIWFSGRLSGDMGVSRYIFVMYQTEKQTWNYIDAHINDEYYISDIFVGLDNSIWGLVNNISPFTYETEGFLLRKFNSVTNQFENVDYISTTPLPFNTEMNYEPYISFDDNNIFWIFISNEGVYRYNPETLIFEKTTALDFPVENIASSSDGSIYFDNDQLYFLDDTMFQFLPDTQEIISFETPGEEWPIYNGLLVDESNRLWLGSTGYRDENGNWYLLHPDPNLFFENLGITLWAPPEILTQTSDGRIWFSKYLDTGGQFEGTAWYDPETGEGCMITNWPSNVIEDDDQNLWILVEDTLYRRPVGTE